MRTSGKIVILLLLTLQTCFAQCPTPVNGVHYFSTQEEVTAFEMNFPDCDSIEGTVQIGKDRFGRVGTVEDISGLASIRFIDGDLYVTGNTRLNNVKGLNVEQVNGAILVSSNINLTDASRLSEILCEELMFRNNKDLIILGLEDGAETRRVHIEGSLGVSQLEINSGGRKLDLFISENESLDSILLLGMFGQMWFSDLKATHVLNSKTGVTEVSALNIFGCSEMQNIDITTNLEEIEGGVSLVDVAAPNLGFLRSVKSMLGITLKNLSISNLSGLENAHLSEIITMEDNNLLSDISQLETTLLETDLLFLKGNPNLLDCSVLCPRLKDPVLTTVVENNGVGCSDTTEIRQSCTVGIHGISEKLPVVIRQGGQVVVEYAENDAFISAFTLTGQMLFSGNLGENGATIEVGSVSPIVLRISDADGKTLWSGVR